MNTRITTSFTLTEDVIDRKDVEINAEFCGLREDKRKGYLQQSDLATF